MSKLINSESKNEQYFFHFDLIKIMSLPFFFNYKANTKKLLIILNNELKAQQQTKRKKKCL